MNHDLIYDEFKEACADEHHPRHMEMIEYKKKMDKNYDTKKKLFFSTSFSKDKEVDAFIKS